MILQKEKWLGGKRFAYSVTYDEGFVDLLENTLPVHERFGFPGQLGMVAGQLGRPRQVEGSSWNGKLHMDASQIREFLAQAWGVSSHSMTHGAARSMYRDPYTEVAGSRAMLEDKLGIPITSFIVPYDNDNHPPVIDLARQHGYLSLFTLTDDVNNYGCDRYALYRSPLVEQGFYPFYSRLDPYMRLHQAREQRGWVVDYTHLTNPRIVAPTKEISQASLIRRFEKVQEVGAGEVWAANCDEVIDYMLTYEGSEVLPCSWSEDAHAWRIALNVPARVSRRTLTFTADQGTALRVATAPPRPVLYHPGREGQTTFSVPVEDGLVISISQVMGGRTSNSSTATAPSSTGGHREQ